MTLPDGYESRTPLFFISHNDGQVDGARRIAGTASYMGKRLKRLLTSCNSLWR